MTLWIYLLVRISLFTFCRVAATNLHHNDCEVKLGCLGTKYNVERGALQFERLTRCLLQLVLSIYLYDWLRLLDRLEDCMPMDIAPFEYVAGLDRLQGNY